MLSEIEVDRALIRINKKYRDSMSMRGNRWQWKIENIYFHLRKFDFIVLAKLFLLRFIMMWTDIKKKHTENYAHDGIKIGVNGKRIAVYSCIIGKYDDIIEPLIAEEGVDYLMFTDLDVPHHSKWKKIDIKRWEEYETLSPTVLNRKLKFLAHRYLKSYDYSIYIDGTIEIVSFVSPLINVLGKKGLGIHRHPSRDCAYDEARIVKFLKKADVKLTEKQMREYKENGFPQHFGLFDNTVLIRNHHDENICHFMEQCWTEYMRYPTRDQLIFPYILWRSKMNLNELYIWEGGLQANLRFNKRSHNEYRILE